MNYNISLLLLICFACRCAVDASSVARKATPKRRLGGAAAAVTAPHQILPGMLGVSPPKPKNKSKKKGAAKKAKKKIPSDAIKYGQPVIIQNAGHYRRVLVGSWDKKKNNIKTVDVWEKKVPDRESQWQMLEYTSSGGRKKDDCVRYGAPIIFKQINTDESRPYLGTCDSDGGKDGCSRSFHDSDDGDEKNHFTFVIRSNPGETGSASVTNDDPAKGLCVVDLSKALIQSFRTTNSWLKGAYGSNNEYCNFKDIFDGDELEETEKFMWIIRKDKGLGHQDEGIQCLATAATGMWNYLATATGGDYTITYTEGVTRTKDRSETSENNWSVSVSATVSANFAFGSVSSTVTGTYGGSASQTVSNSLAKNKDISHATTWYEKGVIWQYSIHMKDLCVPDWEVTTNEVFMTASRNEPPCCLPGQFYDLDRPHGPCMKDSPCQCDKATCEAFEKEVAELEEDEEGEEESESSEEESESESEDSEDDDTPRGDPSTPTGGNYKDDDDAWLQEYMGGSGGGGNYYADDFAYYDDYYDDDYATNGPYGAGIPPPPPTTPPKFMYNGGGPLFSLNINQANTNNNGEGSSQGSNNGANAANANDNSNYGYPDGSGLDDDVSLDDDANNDDYLDIVLDALDSLGIEDADMARRNLLRGAEAEES